MLTPHRLAFFVCGSLFAFWGPSPWFALSQLLALMIAFHQRLSPSIFACAMLGWFLGQVTWTDRADYPQRTQWRLTVDRTTIDHNQTVLLKNGDGRYIWRHGARRWCAGTVIELSGRLIPPIAQGNPGQMAPYRHQLSRGILGQIKGIKKVQVVSLPSALQDVSCQTRQGVYDHLKRVLTPTNKTLAAALLLGERLPDLRAARDQLNGLGLTHLIAVSGLHIGLALSLLLCLLCLPCLLSPRCHLTGWRLRSVILASALTISWWCAWPVGGVRICVWAAVACLAPHRPLTVTGWVSLGLLVGIEPRFSADLGFLLSHGVSLALVHAVHRWKSPLTVPLVATLASLPSLSLVGLPCSLFGIAANLIFVPIFSLVLVITGLSLLFNQPILADQVLSLFTHTIGTVNESVSPQADPFHWSIHTAIGLSLTGIASVQRRWVNAWFCAGIAAFCPPSEPGTQVWMLPVGHGDMAYVRTPKTQVVIDTGPSIQTVTNTLVPRLKRPLDALVISHADHDHIGGAIALCDRHAPKQLWSQTEIPKCPQARLPQTTAFADLTINRLDTADDWVRGRNERSLVVAISVPGHRLLFLGDIGMDREQDLAQRIGQATIVKVPHHGSRSSSSPELVREVSAAIALIGAGPNDRFGHPHADIVQRWKNSGALVETADQTERCWTLHPNRLPKRCAALAYGRQSPAMREQNLR